MRTGWMILAPFLASCGAEDFNSRERELLDEMTPLLPAPADPSNRWWNDRAAADLGREFFFDRSLSGNASNLDVVGRPAPHGRVETGTTVNISCADCHDLDRGGVDQTSNPNQTSIGAGWFDVNAPTVTNSVYYDVWMWNGRADSLWAVASIALGGRVALNASNAHIEAVVSRPEYSAKFKEVFPEPEGTEEERQTQIRVWVAKALAAYMQTLVERETPFDLHMAGLERMPDAAVRGAKLFVGRAGCVECHNGPRLTDDDFHNTGVPPSAQLRPTEQDCIGGTAACDCVDGTNCPPWGAYVGLGSTNPWRRTGPWSDDPADTSKASRYTMSPPERLKGAWRTPSLRDVSRTGPYMHNGAYATLEEVVWHYVEGGTQAGAARAQKSPVLQPLHLTEAEVADLVAFLEALTNIRNR